MMARWRNLVILVALGAGWGLSMPLTKIVVSAGYQHFGLIFWQFVCAAVLLGCVLTLMGRLHWPDPQQVKFAALIACIGTLLPNSASYQAMAHLPSGVISILMSSIPMLAFPIALALGNDSYTARKFLGLTLGFAAVCVIAVISSSFDGNVTIWWVLIALIGPGFYAIEGNIVSKWGTFGLDAMQVLFWSSALGIVPAAVLALSTGQFISPLRPFGSAEFAFLGTALIHAVVYTGYVWLVGRAGAVFSAQVSYLVTLFGVFWAIILLGERYGHGVWLALALMMLGLVLVLPKNQPPTPPQGH